MRVIGLIFALLGLAGCVSNGVVPKTWTDAQARPSSCDQIQGRYSNEGSEPDAEHSQNRGAYKVRLTSALHFYAKEAAEAPAVLLSLGDSGVGKFTPVTASGEAVQTSSKLVLTCHDGVLSWSGSIRDIRDNNVGDPLVGPDRVSIELRRGADGALYFESREVVAGLAYMFFPIGGSETRHYRFPPIK